MFYSLARSLMFCTDAEFSHHLALGSLKHLKNLKTENIDLKILI